MSCAVVWGCISLSAAAPNSAQDSLVIVINHTPWNSMKRSQLGTVSKVQLSSMNVAVAERTVDKRFLELLSKLLSKLLSFQSCRPDSSLGLWLLDRQPVMTFEAVWDMTSSSRCCRSTLCGESPRA